MEFTSKWFALGKSRDHTGTPGNDYLYGDDRANRIMGSDGDDQIRGRGGNDMLYGGAGDDKINGGMGNDRIWGGAGSDVLIGGGGRNKFMDVTAEDHFVYAEGTRDDIYFKFGGKAGNGGNLDIKWFNPDNDRIHVEDGSKWTVDRIMFGDAPGHKMASVEMVCFEVTMGKMRADVDVWFAEPEVVKIADLGDVLDFFG